MDPRNGETATTTEPSGEPPWQGLRASAHRDHQDRSIDFFFWREGLDKLAVPAVGAYLGQVLVHHLDGQWIPRDKLMENQVLVGDRVWLPFIRAWHYLRSRQSLLDFSLTQLYREAERHRAPVPGDPPL